MNIKFKGVLRGLLWVGLGVVLADLIYRFGVELITVPSASMENSIPAGEQLWINKLIPGPRVFVNNPSMYHRLPGLRNIKYNDIIVFNFPDADTIVENRPGESYHFLKRQFPGMEHVPYPDSEWGTLKHLDVDDRPRMIKRVVALPGDILQISGGEIFINGSRAKDAGSVIRLFKWVGDSAMLEKVRATKGINPLRENGAIFFELTSEQVQGSEILKEHCRPELLELNFPDLNVFPFKPFTGWNVDYMGPIYLPKKGDTIKLTIENIHVYYRLIEAFEENQVDLRDNQIIINGQKTDSYTFKLNYYWVMGDNRPHSFDSRYWGPVPENHIVGVVGK